MSIFGHEPTSREVVEANYTRMDSEIAALRAKVGEVEAERDRATALLGEVLLERDISR